MISLNVSGHRPPVGHELLDSTDGKDEKRMNVCLYGSQDTGIQTDPSAQPVDQRLRTNMNTLLDRDTKLALKYSFLYLKDVLQLKT